MSDQKVQELTELAYTLSKQSKRDLRDQVVLEFLKEKAGYWEGGIKHVTVFKYYVEKLSDGRRIFLYRPTFLNKGIDFQVWVERFDGTKDKKPSHKDVLGDLKRKKKENQKATKELLRAIKLVWSCVEPDVAIKSVGAMGFKRGHSPELLLKVLKWLFIEQDVTYWNYDGRSMLFIAVCGELGAEEEIRNITHPA